MGGGAFSQLAAELISHEVGHLETWLTPGDSEGVLSIPGRTSGRMTPSDVPDSCMIYYLHIAQDTHPENTT